MSTARETKGNSPTQQPLLGHIEAEDWIGRRLLEHGCDLYLAGDFPTYRDRLRAAIVANGIGLVIIGRHDGRPETYSACFQRLYGEPLVPKAKRAGKAATT